MKKGEITMGQEVHYVLKRGSELSPDEIAMLEAAASMPVEYDEDNPEIDPIHTPELYSALLRAAGERNRRIARRRA